MKSTEPQKKTKKNKKSSRIRRKNENFSPTFESCRKSSRPSQRPHSCWFVFFCVFLSCRPFFFSLVRTARKNADEAVKASRRSFVFLCVFFTFCATEGETVAQLTRLTSLSANERPASDLHFPFRHWKVVLFPFFSLSFHPGSYGRPMGFTTTTTTTISGRPTPTFHVCQD